MKNNKKISYKNRVKWFYTQSENENGKNRLKADQVKSAPQESNDEEQEDNQDLENPEEESDLS